MALFHESFFCRRFALTLEAKAYEAPMAAAEHVSTLNPFTSSVSRTKRGRSPSKASEESHGADILASESVLNGGHQSTGSSHGQGCADGVCDGISRVIGVFLVFLGRHGWQLGCQAFCYSGLRLDDMQWEVVVLGCR
jgi:hypothetical protein